MTTQQSAHCSLIHHGLLMLLGLVVWLGSANAASAQDADPWPTDAAGASIADPLVIGGAEANPHEFPWMVAFKLFDPQDYAPYPGADCGGALIDAQWIITAAHCFFGPEGYSDAYLDIRLGEHDLATDAGTEVRLSRGDVEAIFLHPDYDDLASIANTVGDIALVKLRNPVQLTSNIGVIAPASPENGALEADGASATVSGWGQTSERDLAKSDVLLKLEYQVTTDASFAGGCGLDSHNLCMDPSTAPTSAGGSCPGDSGSPLFARDSHGNWRALGVVSSGTADCGSGTDVYTRISHYRESIRNTTQLPLCPEGGVIHVDHTALDGGDGTSWGTAYNDLQDALAVVDPCQIWVAQGTYTPGSGSDRSATFNVKGGIKLYGGFLGMESSLEARNIALNPTILSGEINGDNNPVNNSFHVVSVDGRFLSTISEPVIDGFIISGGNADGISPDNNGGGLFVRSASPAMANLTIQDNYAFASGAGMYFEGFSSGSRFFLSDSVFLRNSSIEGSGGLYSSGSPTLNRVTFWKNTGNSGGGMLSVNGNPQLTDVTFDENGAEFGAGLYLSGGRPVLTNVRFRGNSAEFGGGGMFSFASSPTLRNVLFSGNRASEYGGAYYNVGSTVANTGMINVTMSGNASNQGGAIFHNNNIGTFIAANMLIWNNEDSSGTGTANASMVNLAADDQLDLQYSLIQGWNPLLGNNLDGTNPANDPLFITPLVLTDGKTTAGDLRLGQNSPAINAGNQVFSTLVSTDLDGNPRVIDGEVDLGAYESNTISCAAGGVVYVNHAASGNNDGSSWANAYQDLQDAMAVTAPCEIWVAAGVYKPTQTAGERTASFQPNSGVKLFGGFDGTETERDQRDWRTHLTLLSGDIDSNDTDSDGNQIAERASDIVGSNSYHVLRLDGTSTPVTEATEIDGFIITAGQATGGVYPHDLGGGLYCDGTYAGAICSPTLRHLTFSGNQAVYGGGLYSNGYDGISNPTVLNCRFQGNQANEFGGGAYNDGWAGVSNPQVIGSLFVSNTAFSGAGLYNSGYDGGSARPAIVNSTFVANSATGKGGAIFNDGIDGSISTTVFNSILWDNTAETGSQLYNDGGTLMIGFDLIEQRQGAGIFNADDVTFSDNGAHVDTDPLFVDPSAGDFRLQSASSGINAGSNAYITYYLPDLRDSDLDGGPRIADGIVDLGAYEQSSSVPCTSGDSTVSAGDLSGNLVRQATGTLSTSGVVRVVDGADVTFESGTAIQLNPGFSVEAGAQFRARIASVSCATSHRSLQPESASRMRSPARAAALAPPAPSLFTSAAALPAWLQTHLSDLGVELAAIGQTLLDADERWLILETTQALAAGDANAVADLYRLDLLSDRLELISRSLNGTAGNGPSRYPAADASGELILFQSEADDLVRGDRNGVSDIFLHDLALGYSAPLTAAAGASAHPGIDAAGTTLVYDQRADDGRRATQAITLNETSPVETLSLAVDPTGIALDNHHPAISADGRYLAYLEQHPSPQDATAVPECQVHLYDRQTEVYHRQPCPAALAASTELIRPRFVAGSESVHWHLPDGAEPIVTLNPLR